MPPLGLDEVQVESVEPSKRKEKYKTLSMSKAVFKATIKDKPKPTVEAKFRDLQLFEVKSLPTSLDSDLIEVELSSLDPYASKAAFEHMSQDMSKSNVKRTYMIEGSYSFLIKNRSVRLRVRLSSDMPDFDQMYEEMILLKDSGRFKYEITIKKSGETKTVAPFAIASVSVEANVSKEKFETEFGEWFRPKNVSMWEELTSTVTEGQGVNETVYKVRAMNRCSECSKYLDEAKESYRFEVEYVEQCRFPFPYEPSFKELNVDNAKIVSMAKIATNYRCVPKTMNTWLNASHVRSMLKPKDSVVSKCGFTDSDKAVGEFVVKIDGMPMNFYRFPHVTYLEPAYKGKDSCVCGILFEDMELDMDLIDFERSFEIKYVEMFLGTYMFEIKTMTNNTLVYKRKPSTFYERKHMNVEEAKVAFKSSRLTMNTILPKYEYDGVITVECTGGTQIRYKAPTVDVWLDSGKVYAMYEDRNATMLKEIGMYEDETIPSGVYEAWNPDSSSIMESVKDRGLVELTYMIKRTDKGKPNSVHVVKTEIEAMIEPMSNDPHLSSRIGLGSWMARDLILDKISSSTMIIDVGGGNGRIWNGSEVMAVILIDPTFKHTDKTWRRYPSTDKGVHQAMKDCRTAIKNKRKIRIAFSECWESLIDDLIECEDEDVVFSMIWSTTYCKELIERLDEDKVKFAGVGMFYDKCLSKDEDGNKIVTNDVLFSSGNCSVTVKDKSVGVYKVRDASYEEPLFATWELPKSVRLYQAKDMIANLPWGTDEYFSNVFFVFSNVSSV